MKNLLPILFFLTLLFLIPSCQSGNTEKDTSATAAPVYQHPDPAAFTKVVDGKTIGLYIIKNSKGLSASLTNYGARMISFLVPDKNGNQVDVLHGYGTIDEFLNKNNFYGTVVGRYGNRIAKGKFSLNGKSYSLATNNGPNHLHGGPKGFHAQIWDVVQPDSSEVEFTYLSKDGEEGYPGNLTVKVTYSLTEDNGVLMEYEATTDQPTVANLTNHNYWNLDGELDTSIVDHILSIDADLYTPVDSTLIPIGEMAPVDGTPFDFRTPTAIGDRINSDHPQITYGGGYDHNFVFNPKQEDFPLVGSLYSPNSGIYMEFFTQEPGVQFYSGNFIRGTESGKGGKTYVHRSSLCLETQHFPDSPNQKTFPTTTLNPGDTLRTKTLYRFSTKGM